MPDSALALEQTLVDGHDAWVDDFFGDCQFALEFDRMAEEGFRSAKATKKGGARGEFFLAGPGGDVIANGGQMPILRRLRLFLFEHTDHNQYRHEPIRNDRLGASSRSRVFLFGLQEGWQGQPDQRFKIATAFACLSHPWDLLWLVSFWQKKHNHGGSMRLGQL